MATAVLQPSESIASGLGPAGRALAERHWLLALGLARRFVRRYAHLDLDFEGEAGLALCQVALRFESQLDGSAAPEQWFRRHLRSRVLGACYDLLRQSYPRGYQQRKRSRWGEIPRLTQFGADPEYLLISGEAPVGREIEEGDAFERRLAALPAPQRRVLEAVYRDDLTRSEAARALGCYPSYVTRLHDAGINLIKEQLCVR